MKKLFLKISFLTLVIFAPVSAMAGVSVHVDIPLPPAIVFAAPPMPVVVPETDVYVVPDVQEDIFFYGGWWWRPWQGRWYRSHYYDRGWGYYRGAPAFHRNIPSGWRNDYREHRWKGHPWEGQRVPHQELQRNWQGWQKNRHWERNNSWGVQGLPPGKRQGNIQSRQNQPGQPQGGPQGRQSNIRSRQNQPGQPQGGPQGRQGNIQSRQHQSGQPQGVVHGGQGHGNNQGDGKPQGKQKRGNRPGEDRPQDGR